MSPQIQFQKLVLLVAVTAFLLIDGLDAGSGAPPLVGPIKVLDGSKNSVTPQTGGLIAGNLAPSQQVTQQNIGDAPNSNKWNKITQNQLPAGTDKWNQLPAGTDKWSQPGSKQPTDLGQLPAPGVPNNNPWNNKPQTPVVPNNQGPWNAPPPNAQQIPVNNNPEDTWNAPPPNVNNNPVNNWNDPAPQPPAQQIPAPPQPNYDNQWTPTGSSYTPTDDDYFFGQYYDYYIYGPPQEDNTVSDPIPDPAPQVSTCDCSVDYCRMSTQMAAFHCREQMCG